MKFSLYNFCKIGILILVKLLYKYKKYYISIEKCPGGAIIAANHASFFDPIFLGISWHEELHFLARDSLFRNFIFSWLISKLNSHPIARDKMNLSFIKEISKLIKKGNKIVMFPEGQRSDDGNIKLAKSGIGMLAMHVNCPVIPVYIHGSYDIWNKKNKMPKFFKNIACVYGKPILPQEFINMDHKQAKKALSEKVMNSISQLKDWYLSVHLNK